MRDIPSFTLKFLSVIYLARLIHAHFFESRLAQHIANFADRRSELQLLLQGYTTGQVHETNEISHRLEFKLDHVEKAVVTIASYLRKLDTPREREVMKFAESHGGLAKCITDGSLLPELLEKSGEGAGSDGSGPGKGSGDCGDRGNSLNTWREELLKELNQNMDEVMQKHLGSFEAVLRIHENNMKQYGHLMENSASTMQKLANQLALAFPGRKHVLLTDPVGWVQHFIPFFSLTCLDRFCRRFGSRWAFVKASRRRNLCSHLRTTTSVCSHDRLPCLPARRLPRRR